MLLIALFIWYAGPYFAFGDYRPLDTELRGSIAIALVVVCWAAVGRCSSGCAPAGERQARGARCSASRSRSRNAPSPEAAKLRERFEEAVGGAQAAAAKRPQPLRPAVVRVHRRAGLGQDDRAGQLGAEVSRSNSGSARARSAASAARATATGGSPTRPCFSTPPAATRRRIPTPPSDSAGWTEFLALLRKYRKRRPINGVILTISAQDLLTQGDAEREAHVDAARRRLNELNRELRIQLPVYVMVTKCDLVAGFTEYFDDLTQEGRAQVWGVTFPYEQTLSGEAAGRVRRASSTR